MFKQSIRTNITLTFLFLLSAIAFALIYTQYYFNSKLAIASTTKTFELVGENILDEVEKTHKRVENTLSANVDNTNLNYPIHFNSDHRATQNLIRILETGAGMFSIYFAHKDGSMLEVIDLHEFKSLYEVYDIPKTAKWLVLKSVNNQTQYRLLDHLYKTIATYKKRSTLKPLEREWYKKALGNHEVQMMEPYIFNSIKELGTTYMVQTQQKGTVLGIDFTMQKVSKFLSVQKFDDGSEIFMFNEQGKKFVSSDKVIKNRQDMTMIAAEMMQAFINRDKRVVKYKDKGKKYLAMYLKIERNLYLGIRVDTRVLLKPYIESMQYSLMISALLLLLSLPIIFFAVSKIVKPIKALVKENEKIKNRDFDDVKEIKSNIVEFRELSKSQVQMSHSISEYQKSQAELLDAIVKLIAEAVDAKSLYTGGHCKRVPQIAQMLVNEASLSQEDAFKEFKLESEDELREFEIGAWLHDCGKVTTPEYVVDKATKLETIYDRIHEIRTRFEVLYRDAQIACLEAEVNGEDKAVAQDILTTRHKQLGEDFAFIASVNIGGEFMSQEKQTRVKSIANEEWIRHFDDTLGLGVVEILRKDKSATLPAKEKLLSDKQEHIIKRENFDYESYEEYGFKEDVPEYLYNYGEVYNLCIEKGTLSAEERYKINEHVILTIKMLEKIPFPSHMTKIPEYAGTHHETLVGTGYPRQLTKDELSIPARIMALADVFEALTASDRPYKKAKTLSESIKILSFMVKDEHLDTDIFRLFLSSGIYKVYAKEYLKEDQIDEVDIKEYLSA